MKITSGVSRRFISFLILNIFISFCVPLAADATPSYITYFAVYCQQGGSLSTTYAQDNVLKCHVGGTKPLFEADVSSLTTDPQGSHLATTVEADCYPDTSQTPHVPSAAMDHISCGSSPNATLTLGSTFPPSAAAAPPAPSSPASGTGAASDACSNLDLTGSSAEAACEHGYNACQPDSKTKDCTVSKDTACPASSYPSSTDLDACRQGWDVAAHLDPAVDCTSGNCNLIARYVNPIINSLSVAFGLIAVISLILGGIQFTASEGDPQKAAQAKHRISNTILAIFVYSLFYGFIQFLVPGGLFH